MSTSPNERKYRSGNPLQQFLIRRFFDRVADLLRKCDATAIVDLGSGEGFALDHLRRRLPLPRTYALDLNRSALRKLPATETHRVQADLSSLPLRAGAADVVLLLEVLEHLPDSGPLWKEIRRLQPRWVLVSVPHEPWFRLANAARGKHWSRWGLDPEHCQAWSRSAFLRYLEPMGRVTDLVSPFPWTLVRLALDNPPPGGARLSLPLP